MGGGSSKIRTVDNKVIANNFDLDKTSELLNKQISDTVVTNARQCSSANGNEQYIRVKNLVVGGNSTLDASQTQDVAVSLDCVQKAETYNEIKNNIVSQIADNIEVKSDTTALDKMIAGMKNTGADETNTTILNTTKLKLKNVVNNVFENKFKASNLDSCISKVSNLQSQQYDNVSMGDNSKLVLGQTQAVTQLTKCLQESKVMNGLLTDVANKLQIDISSSNTTNAGKTVDAPPQESIFQNYWVWSCICSICLICIVGIIILAVVFKGGDIIEENPELLQNASLFAGGGFFNKIKNLI